MGTTADGAAAWYVCWGGGVLDMSTRSGSVSTAWRFSMVVVVDMSSTRGSIICRSWGGDLQMYSL